MSTSHPRQPNSRRLARAVAAAACTVALIIPTVPAMAASTDLPIVRQAADPQTHVGGGVTVKVSRLDIADVIAFNIVLDTHTIDLDVYDLSQLAVLRTPAGDQIGALAWEAPAGGHHREGTLSFPATAAREFHWAT